MFISLRSLIIQFHSIQLIDWNGLIHWTRYIRHSVNTPFSRPFSLRDSCLAHLVSFGLFFIHSGSLHSIKQPSFIKFNELFIPFHYINLLSLNSFHSKFIAHTISLSSINFTHLTFVELIWAHWNEDNMAPFILHSGYYNGKLNWCYKINRLWGKLKDLISMH